MKTKLKQQALSEYLLNNSMARQAIINGNFDVWQRGTSFSAFGGAFSADRWSEYHETNSGTLPTRVRTRETMSPGELFGSYYFTRLNTNGAGVNLSADSMALYAQKIEFGTRYLCGANKKVTISFWARSSIANKKIGVYIRQTYGTGGSPSAGENINGKSWTLTSTWQKYTHTIETNTLSGKTFGTDNNDYLQLYFMKMWGASVAERVGESSAETFGGAGNVDIAQVQLCAGEVALLFMPKSFDEELSACQRYFQKSMPYKTAPANGNGRHNLYGLYTYGVTAGRLQIYFSKQMRSAPTITFYRTGDGTTDGNAAWYTDSWASVLGTFTDAIIDSGFVIRCTISGATSSYTYLLSVGWTADAEL